MKKELGEEVARLLLGSFGVSSNYLKDSLVFGCWSKKKVLLVVGIIEELALKRILIS